MSETTDDFLEHYGVRGMKWGKRSGGSGGGSGKNGKVTSGDIHLARQAQNARFRNLSKAEEKYYAASTKKGEAKAKKVLEKLEKDFINNPDAKMAIKATKGEKIAAGIMYGMAAAFAVSAISSTRAMSR